MWKRLPVPVLSRIAVLYVHYTYGSKTNICTIRMKVAVLPLICVVPISSVPSSGDNTFFNRLNYFWKKFWPLGSADDKGTTHIGGSAAIVCPDCANVFYIHFIHRPFNVGKVANPCSSRRAALDVHYIPHLLVLSLGNETPGGSVN